MHEKQFLRRVVKASRNGDFKNVMRKAKKEDIEELVGAIVQLLRKTTPPLKKKTVKVLQTNRRLLRHLVHPTYSWRSKRRYMVQKGGAFPAILAMIGKALFGLMLRAAPLMMRAAPAVIRAAPAIGRTINRLAPTIHRVYDAVGKVAATGSRVAARATALGTRLTAPGTRLGKAVKTVRNFGKTRGKQFSEFVIKQGQKPHALEAGTAETGIEGFKRWAEPVMAHAKTLRSSQQLPQVVRTWR
jgi:hypothetical protein